MRIDQARWVYVDDQGRELPATARAGYPILELVLDGRPTRLDPEQRYLASGYAAVYLGADWEDVIPPLEHPGDSAAGVPAQRLSGFTSDPAIVRLVRKFVDAVANDSFKPGTAATVAA